jgi:hypothetical protein
MVRGYRRICHLWRRFDIGAETSLGPTFRKLKRFHADMAVPFQHRTLLWPMMASMVDSATSAVAIFVAAVCLRSCRR